MKIIWKPNKSIIVRCNVCGGILEVTKEDMDKSEFHFDNIFTCPICESSSAISSEEMLLLDYLEKIKEK